MPTAAMSVIDDPKIVEAMLDVGISERQIARLRDHPALQSRVLDDDPALLPNWDGTAQSWKSVLLSIHEESEMAVQVPLEVLDEEEFRVLLFEVAQKSWSNQKSARNQRVIFDYLVENRESRIIAQKLGIGQSRVTRLVREFKIKIGNAMYSIHRKRLHEQQTSRFADFANTPLEDLELHQHGIAGERALKLLKRKGIHTVGQLLEHSERQIEDITNFGRSSLIVLKECLDRVGLSLKAT